MGTSNELEHLRQQLAAAQESHQQTIRNLKYQVALDILVTNISTGFIEAQPKNLKIEMGRALQLVGEFTDVDYSYTIFFSDEGNRTESLMEWYRAGDTPPSKKKLEQQSVELRSWFMEEITEHSVLMLPQMIAEIAQKSISTDNIKSLIVVPLVQHEHIMGLMGLESFREEKTWEKEKKIMTLLKIVGNVFVQALNRQQAEEEMQQQELIMVQQARHAQMGEMISMIAHQWRQPLSTISTIAGNMLVQQEIGIMKEDESKENLEKIIGHTQYLSNTINDFRNFFSTKKKVDLVFLVDLLQNTLALIGKSLESRNIQLEQHCSLETKIPTYSNELMQVFLNILKNAQDAITERQVKDGTIKIRMYQKDQHQVVEIEDNAGGIPEDVMDNLFLPYFTTKDELNGTGLGLYMSKTIVEKHLKGVLSAQNEQGGAKFIIQLPVGALGVLKQ
ncbi:MAG: HAMP domain-containing histidine kinase [SAR324 cluster bacterium]|nr:HAMP domain-containing histidine kinase [SAR324 cluster bacterium]